MNRQKYIIAAIALVVALAAAVLVSCTKEKKTDSLGIIFLFNSSNTRL